MSGVKKNATVTIMPQNFFCSEGRNSTIDPANEERIHTMTIMATTDPVNNKQTNGQKVTYNLMDSLVCNIERDFLRVMLHFATESEARDTTH